MAVVVIEAAEAAGSNENCNTSDKRERSKDLSLFLFLTEQEYPANGQLAIFPQQKAPAGFTDKGLTKFYVVGCGGGI